MSQKKVIIHSPEFQQIHISKPHALMASQASLNQLYKIQQKYKEKMKHLNSITWYCKKCFCFWYVREKRCALAERSAWGFLYLTSALKNCLIHYVLWLRHLQWSYIVCLSYGNTFVGPGLRKLNGITETFCARLVWSSLWVSVPEDLIMNWKVKKKKKNLNKELTIP